MPGRGIETVCSTIDVGELPTAEFATFKQARRLKGEDEGEQGELVWMKESKSSLIAFSVLRDQTFRELV